jgi:hypothetical protein
MDVYCPQLYGDSMGIDPEELPALLSIGGELGIAEWCPTLEGSSSPEYVRRAIQICRDFTVQGDRWWRMGLPSRPQLEVIRDNSLYRPDRPLRDPTERVRLRLDALRNGLETELSRRQLSRKRLDALLAQT